MKSGAILSILAVSIFGLAQAPHTTGARSQKAEAVEVMHCLKDGDLEWLGNSPVLDRAKQLKAGLRHDRKSYEHEDHIIVVVFENRLRGDVFDLTREDHKSHRTYRVENNGEFQIRGKNVKWLGEILGGNWTHDYIERNIRKILHGPKLQIPARTLLRPIPAVTCTSFVTSH